MYYKDGAAWKKQFLYSQFGDGKTVVIGDADPAHSGNELVWVSSDGNATLSYATGTTWTHKVIYRTPAPYPGLNRVSIGDIDNDGQNEILLTGNVKDVIVLELQGSDWKPTTIFTETDKARGSWIDNVYDGNGDDNEGISGGYSGNVTLHVYTGTTWKHAQIFNDGGQRLHHIITADVDPDHPGKEIVAGGYAKKCYVLAQYHSTYDLTAQTMSIEVKTETTATYNFNLTAKEYFSGKVTMSVTGLPEGATATFNAPDYLVSFVTVAKMDVSVPFSVASGTYTLTVTATDTVTPRTATVTLKVTRDLSYTVTAPVRDMQVKASDIGIYNVTIKNAGDIKNTYNVSLTATSQNWSSNIIIGETSVELDPGAEASFTVEVKAPEDASKIIDTSTITITPQIGSETKTVTFTTTVPEKEKKKAPGPFLETAFLAVAIALAALIVAAGRKRWA